MYVEVVVGCCGLLKLYCVELVVGCCSLSELYCVEVVVGCCSLSELYCEVPSKQQVLPPVQH